MKDQAIYEPAAPPLAPDTPGDAPFLATLTGRAILRLSRLTRALRFLRHQDRRLLSRLGVEMLDIPLAPHQRLAALRLTGIPNPAAGPRLPVVMAHGWMETKELHLREASMLAQQGHDVLLFDMRAHGRSSGSHFSFGAHERQDVSRLLDELERRGWSHGRVLTMGFSAGASLMLLHAAFEKRVAGVVAYAPFYDLSSALESFRQMHSPFIKPEWLVQGMRQATREAGFHLDQCAIHHAVRQLTAPALFVVGDRDRNLPALQHTHLLASHKTQGLCHILDVPGADHLSLCRRCWPGVDEQVARFCAQVSL